MGRHAPVSRRGSPQYLEVQHSAEERRAHRLLTEYAASRRKAAGGEAGQAAADFVTTLLKKRLFSSPKAFAETIETHLKHHDQAVSCRWPGGSGTGGRPASALAG